MTRIGARPYPPIVINGTFDYPVTINGLGYPLAGLSNTLDSQEVVADQPTSIDFVLYDYNTIAHFTLYMNLHDTDIHYFNSDTFIRLDNGNLQVTDPNGWLANVTVTQETDEKYSFKTNVNFLVTFNETMGNTNLVVRTWDSRSSTTLAHMIDAITVIPAANATATPIPADPLVFQHLTRELPRPTCCWPSACGQDLTPRLQPMPNCLRR